MLRIYCYSDEPDLLVLLLDVWTFDRFSAELSLEHLKSEVRFMQLMSIQQSEPTFEDGCLALDWKMTRNWDVTRVTMLDLPYAIRETAS
jgi:hypothetical protein